MSSTTSNTDQKTFVVFDIETTGFKVEKGHEILEIGAEKLVGKEVAERFHAMLIPECPIPEEVISIHGITQDIVDTEGKNPKEVILDFLSFAKDSILVGHNIGFDLGFVNAYAQKFGFPILRNQTLDTCEIARKNLIIPSYSLERVSKYFGIKNPQAHRALADVEVTRKVFLKLLERVLASKA